MSHPTPTSTFLVHGAEIPPVPPRRLKAGPLTLDYDHGDLRGVRLGDRELIRRVYGAVRDCNWGTVPGVLSDECIESDSSTFRVTYTCTHRQGAIDFVWRAELSGDADGTIRFGFEGEARSTFLRNRIGLCVLHPIRDCAGARVRLMLSSGAERGLIFPERIAAEQPIRGFDTLAGLTHEVSSGIWVEVRFQGERFETEDQRNWIDASFKTYGTPLSLPFPVKVSEGTRIRQRVEVRLLGVDRSTEIPKIASRPITGVSTDPVTLEVSLDRQRLPAMGLGVSWGSLRCDARELARLRALNLSHLRTDLTLADPEWLPRLEEAAAAAGALGLPLELALHLPAEGGSRELGALRGELIQRRLAIARVLAFQTGQRSTTAAVLAAVRDSLGGLTFAIGVGTNADLYQLNLQRPPSDAAFICWSMNPQVHATDSRSLMETPEAAAEQIVSVRGYYPGVPLVISPVTLRPRFNPTATNAESSRGAEDLPACVDPRQMALIGAAWTVAMIAALAPQGVASVSFFETMGWRGVMEAANGSPLPDRFPSIAGGVFPLWHVFAAMAGFHFVSAVVPSVPGRVAAFALADEAGRTRVVLANLTPEWIEVNAEQLNGPVRLLAGEAVADAMREPEAWWQHPGRRLGGTLQLSAYAVAIVDPA